MKTPRNETHGIRRQLRKAMDNVQREISANARGGKYAAGLSAEGFAGGYQAALSDVLLALNGVTPNNSRWWPQPGTPQRSDTQD